MGTPPTNHDFAATPTNAGTPPTNHDFVTGDFGGWTTSGTVSLQSDATRGFWAQLQSQGELVSEPFTVDADAQQVLFEIGYLHATLSSNLTVYVLSGANYATQTQVAFLSCTNCGWTSSSFDAGPYWGLSIKLKFKATFGTIGIDAARPVLLLPGYTTSGVVNRIDDGAGATYASLATNGTMTSAPFTITAESQLASVRLKGLSTFSDQYRVEVLSGANFATVTQVASGIINDSWQTVSWSVGAWQGQQVKLRVTRTFGTVGVDDVGLQQVIVPGWQIGNNTSLVDEGNGNHYLAAKSALVSAAFTLSTDVQQLTLRHRGQAAGATVSVSLLRGASFGEEVGLISNTTSDASLWKTLKLGVGAGVGETVKLKITPSASGVFLDDAGVGESILPGWQTTTNGAVITGTDQYGSYISPAPEVNAFILQSSDISTGVIDDAGVDSRYYAIAYETGFNTGGLLQVFWVNEQGTQWTVFQDAANTPTGYRLRYFPLQDFMGPRGHLLVKIANSGRVYSISENVARQHHHEPYSLKTGSSVDTTTGRFHYQIDDLVIQGTPPITLTRSYNGHSDRLSALGYGWSHNFETHLILSQDGDASAVLGNGGEIFFDWNPTSLSFTAADGRAQEVLVKNGDSSFTLTDTASQQYSFDASGRLTSIVGTITTTLSYNGSGQLATVTTGGTTLTFTYDASSRLISVSDGAATANYGYDGNGVLNSVTRPSNSESYTYVSHRLTQVVDSSAGQLVQNQVDSVGRISQQTDSQGNSITIQYGVPDAGVTAVTDSSGSVTYYYFDDYGRTTDVVYANGQIVNYIYDAIGNLVDTIVGQGNQTPTVSVSANPTSGDAPLTVNFTATASDPDNDPLTYSWAFGDGASAGNSATASRQYTQMGVFTATITVNDGAASASAQVAITVTEPNQPPAVSVVAAPMTGTVPLAVAFTATAGDPDNDLLTYDWVFGDGATASGAPTVTHTYSQSGLYTATVTVSDGAASASAGVAISVSDPPPPNGPPTVSLSATPSAGDIPLAVSFTATASDPDNDPLIYHWIFGDGGTGGDSTATSHTYTEAGIYTATVTVSDGALSANAQVQITANSNIPVLNPPPVDPTVPTTVYESTKFLYTGSDPVQTGMVSGTIEPRRAAVVRGRVLTSDGQPLPGVTVTIHNHAEFGSTISRTDGYYDLAVNGGGYLTLSFTRSGSLPAQRQIDVPWQEFAVVDDLVMLPLDPMVTTVVLSASVPIQVVQGGVISDSDGIRQSTLLIPQGTQAEMVMPGGITQTLTTLNIRATEYTVGPRGPEAMPASLPPQSGYTYAVEFSVDEALAAGATDVRFSQPLYHYVENFLDFPVGTAVPSGYYDRARSQWIASPDGRVVKIVDVGGGFAELDTDGDGIADNDPSLGISNAERSQLAVQYGAGVSLWRVPITHFTPYDFNWPPNWGPFGGPPPPGNAPSGDRKPDDPCEVVGSVIECQSQVVGQRVDLAGVPFALNYRSDRTRGRTPYLGIVASGSTISNTLQRIEVIVEVGGRWITQTLPPAPNQTYTFAWDGLDAYGRAVQGTTNAKATVGYIYDGVYGSPTTSSGPSFGQTSLVAFTANPMREEVALWRENDATLGTWDARMIGLGGWNLDVHHGYDIIGQLLYLGDSERRGAQSVYLGIETVAGNGQWGYSGDNLPALQVKLSRPNDVAVGPDGSVYIADSGNCRVRRVDPAGIITTVAGTGTCGYNGDGIAATQAQINSANSIAVGPDGSIYFWDFLNHRLRRIGLDDIITTVAGNGTWGFSGDGQPATQAQLNFPEGFAIAPDGSIYLADTNNNRVRRVAPDGIISTVAGNGSLGYNGDDIPATQARLWTPRDVAVGPDGSLYIADDTNHRVRKVTPDGVITTVAGSGGTQPESDGVPATLTAITGLIDIEVDPSGRVFILQNPGSARRIRVIETSGIIRTLAGGVTGINPDINGSAPAATTLNTPYGMALGPDGMLYFAEWLYHRIHRIAPTMPGFDGDSFSIPSADGTQLYQFDANGRHLGTLNTLTGAMVYNFGYDSNGYLITVTDGDGNVTTIERDANGNPSGIVGPYGQRTTLTLNANGYLTSLTNPAGESHQFTYTASGLMTSMTDPRGNSSSYAYDSLGRVTSNTSAVGGVQTFGRVEGASGHTVTRANALGDATGYPLNETSTGASLQLVNAPNGASASTQENPDGTIVKTDARGNTTTTTLSPDPRWGMQAPYVSFLESKGPGGTVFFTMTATRTVTLTTAGDPLSLQNQSDQITVNGRTTTSVYDAAARTMTTTDPAGLVTVTTLDGQGRPLQVATVNLAPVIYTYDSRGRVSSIQEGTGAEQRTTIMTYDALGYLQSVTDALGNVTSYSYDAAGRTTSQTLPTGQVLSYSYDAAGNRISATEAQGVQTTFEYDAANRLTVQTIDPTGRNVRSQYTYDAVGNLLQVTADVGGINKTTTYTYQAFDGQRYLVNQVTDPLGNVTTFSYTQAGDLASVTDPLGRTTTYSYTVQGWLASVTTPGGRTTLTEYNNDSQPTRVTDPRGAQITYTYDSLGRMVSRTAGAVPVGSSSALSLTTSFTYDVNGRMVSVTDPRGRSSSRAYDAFGRTVSESDSLGNVTSYSYDTLDRLVTQTAGSNTPAEAITTSYSYDAVGRRLSMVVDPMGLNLVTQYRYTRAGSSDTWNLQEVVDPKGNLTAYSYNSLGQQESVTDALGQSWTFTYDNLGRLTQQQDPLGHSTSYTVDKLDRTVSLTQDGRTESWSFATDGVLSSYSDFAGQTTSFTYDVDQRLTNIDYPAGTPDVAYTYDAAGNVTSMSDGLGSTTYAYDAANRLISRTRNGKSVVYGYNASSQVTQIDYWGTGMVNYGYDNAGRLSSLTPWGQSATSYSYRSTNLLASQSRGNGVSTTYSYDSASRLTRLLHATSGPTLNDINYVLDANGNRTQMSDGDGSTSYSYDAVNRLTQVQLPAIPSGPAAETIDYTMDAVGNRSSDGSTSYTYDASDRITNAGFSYDANGNLLSDGGGKQYQYDAAKRLTKVISGSLTVDYAYDGWGNLILEASGSVTTEFVLDELSGLTRVLGEVKSDGSQTLYASGPEGFAAQRTIVPGGGDAVDYVLLDGLGSVRHLTDATGTVTLNRSYDAFGSIRHSSGSGLTRMGFTGELHDPNTGLVYLRARHYNPILGRFLQRDTFPGFTDRAQSLHRYAYSENNPVNYTDPSGHFVAPDTALDLGFISYDLYRIVRDNFYYGCDNLGENITALFFDVGGAFIPFATGLGAAYRSGKLAWRVAQWADDFRLLRQTGIWGGTMRQIAQALPPNVVIGVRPRPMSAGVWELIYKRFGWPVPKPLKDPSFPNAAKQLRTLPLGLRWMESLENGKKFLAHSDIDPQFMIMDGVPLLDDLRVRHIVQQINEVIGTRVIQHGDNFSGMWNFFEGAKKEYLLGETVLINSSGFIGQAQKGLGQEAFLGLISEGWRPIFQALLDQPKFGVK